MSAAHRVGTRQWWGKIRRPGHRQDALRRVRARVELGRSTGVGWAPHGHPRSCPSCSGRARGCVAVRETAARLLQRQSERGRLPPVLIQGETGVGKGLLARALHRAGPRAAGPFVDVNCAAIPETLLEAELFGYERGAFTDARHAKAGLFQTANHGTIFLDEVGLLPEALQAKLLKALEDRAVRRLGSTRSEPVDVWIVTASNEDLASGGADATIPRGPLSPPRRGDADHPAAARARRGRAPPRGALPRPGVRGVPAAPAAASRRTRGRPSSRYPWPGNVRELANVMERVALLSEAPVVTAELLGLPAAAGGASGRDTRSPDAGAASRPRSQTALGSVERVHLVEALRQTGGNVTRAAARLGISRDTLRYRMVKHGLAPRGAGATRSGAARPGPTSPPRPATPLPLEAAPPRASGPAAATVETVRVRWRSGGKAGGSRSCGARSSCRPTPIPGSARAAGSRPSSRRSRRSADGSRR